MTTCRHERPKRKRLEVSSPGGQNGLCGVSMELGRVVQEWTADRFLSLRCKGLVKT
jgi:hypothetical protein